MFLHVSKLLLLALLLGSTSAKDPKLTDKTKLGEYWLKLYEFQGRCELTFEGPQNGKFPLVVDPPCEFSRYFKRNDFVIAKYAGVTALFVINVRPLTPKEAEDYRKKIGKEPGCYKQMQPILQKGDGAFVPAYDIIDAPYPADRCPPAEPNWEVFEENILTAWPQINETERVKAEKEYLQSKKKKK